jgi:PKD repeat protein
MAYNPRFTSTPAGGSVARLTPLTFSYTGDTSPAVTGYRWEFGDGCVSNLATPTHRWLTEGDYDVTLTAVYEDGAVYSVTVASYVTIVADSLTDYLDLLLEQFKSRTTLRGLLTPPIDQMAMVGLATDGLLDTWSLASEGIVLDNVGEILGLPRLTRSDAEYRTELARMYRVVWGHGDEESLITYVEVFLDPSYYSILESDMHVLVDVLVNAPQNYVLFYRQLEVLAASGVRVDLVVNEEVPVEFEYTDEPPIYPSGNELSEDSYYEGGYLSECIT